LIFFHFEITEIRRREDKTFCKDRSLRMFFSRGIFSPTHTTLTPSLSYTLSRIIGIRQQSRNSRALSTTHYMLGAPITQYTRTRRRIGNRMMSLPFILCDQFSFFLYRGNIIDIFLPISKTVMLLRLTPRRCITPGGVKIFVLNLKRKKNLKLTLVQRRRPVSHTLVIRV
jgi:hypothetical protein